MNNDKKCCENCGYQAKEWCHPKKDKICKDWCHKSDPLDAGLAERLYKSVKGPCAYPFKWLYPSEKAFWRVVAAEVSKIVKEATEKGSP